MENVTTAGTGSVTQYKMKHGKHHGRYRIYDIYDIIDTRTVIKNGKEVVLNSSLLQKKEHNLELGFNNHGSEWGQRILYPAKFNLEATTPAEVLYNDQKILEHPQNASSGATYQKSTRKLFSNRQIAIAYQLMGLSITKNNALDILEKYSTNRSVQKFLTRCNVSTDEMTFFSELKSQNTKLLHDLKAAKIIISGKKKQKALDEINRIIAKYQATYDKEYGKL